MLAWWVKHLGDSQALLKHLRSSSEVKSECMRDVFRDDRWRDADRCRKRRGLSTGSLLSRQRSAETPGGRQGDEVNHGEAEAWCDGAPRAFERDRCPSHLFGRKAECREQLRKARRVAGYFPMRVLWAGDGYNLMSVATETVSPVFCCPSLVTSHVSNYIHPRRPRHQGIRREVLFFLL